MVNFKYNRRKGTNFLETMIVLVIAGLVASFAMPGYAKYIERSRGKRAETNLNAIYNMEKLYKLDNSVYYECVTVPCSSFVDSKGAHYYSCPATATTPPCSTQIINDALGLFIADSYFDYKIEIDGTAGGYKATATRRSGGLCAGGTLILTSASRTVTKNCAIW
ncbi:MAG: hypothetical protein WC417_07370 [Candidatus Omnitrophota bacterium]|jgi:Tfp pilus assembly protein PilE